MVAQEARRVDGWLSGIPFHPWLFAAFPVIRLYSENLVDAEPGEVVGPLLVVLGATTFGTVALALLLREPRRAAVIVSALLVPVLSFGLVREVLPASLGLGRIPLLALSGAFVLVAAIAALRMRGQLGALTSALNVLSLVLIVLVAVPAARGIADVLGTHDAGGTTPATTTASVAAPDGRAGRDIYHIVLDRYGSERSLRTGFGIDNAPFVAWLREQGFQVVDDAHANYARTLLSLSSTLGMSLLDEIAESAGPEGTDMRAVVRRIQESRAGAFLQDLGYEYVHIGSHFARTGESDIADHVYRPQHSVTFASTLYDLTIFPAVLRQRRQAMHDPTTHAESARHELGILDEIRDDPGPKYVFAHILLPHPPFVFLADGTFAPREATLETQLAYTNARLKAFLEPLLALPEAERPIIILQADEGPYPPELMRDRRSWAEATGDELVTKFGILDAWLMPGPEGEAPLPPGSTAVNTYPELFRRYFGADLRDEPDRIYGSFVDAPFDMLEIGERVAAAELAITSTAAADDGS